MKVRLEVTLFWWKPPWVSCVKGVFTRQRKNGTGPTKTGTVQIVFAKKSDLLSVPCWVHRHLWTRCGTDKSSLFLCKNCWNRSSFCLTCAIFSLSCKCPLNSAILMLICVNLHNKGNEVSIKTWSPQSHFIQRPARYKPYNVGINHITRRWRPYTFTSRSW